MKIIKYIIAFLLFIAAIGEVLPIYLITSGLLSSQGQESSTYFLGKLVGHVFLALIMFYFGLKLFKNAQSNENT